MSNARLFAEALTALHRLVWAAAGWLIFLSTVAAILTVAAIATGAWGARAVRRRYSGPSWARGRLRARIHARARVRRSSGRTGPRAPLWAHTQPIDYEEAA